jgi:hypothetical protein
VFEAAGILSAQTAASGTINPNMQASPSATDPPIEASLEGRMIRGGTVSRRPIPAPLTPAQRE